MCVTDWRAAKAEHEAHNATQTLHTPCSPPARRQVNRKLIETDSDDEEGPAGSPKKRGDRAPEPEDGDTDGDVEVEMKGNGMIEVEMRGGVRVKVTAAEDTSAGVVVRRSQRLGARRAEKGPQ